MATPKQTTPPKVTNTAQIVSGTPDQKNEINIADASGQIATNPDLLMGTQGTLSNKVPTTSAADIQAGTINPNAPKYAQDNDAMNGQVTTAQTSQAGPVTGNQQAAQVETATTQQEVAKPENQLNAAQGQVSDEALIDPNETGINIDEFDQSVTGEALKESAYQDLTNIIDTSTAAGKLLAEQLGQFGYVDSKATLKGQLEILQSEFVDPVTGDPKIPSWAAGTARNVSRIAAFGGMTGTAATAAMAQAIMEASLPIAQADSQFFQTMTIKNLDNKQQAVINRANVLSKIDMANMDQRMTAAVENSKKFMEMDMANLDNEQQAAVINNQNRIQSILEDAKAENANRLFMANSQNEKDMFYSNLSASIDQFNTAQKNNMSQFNASEANDMTKFNKEMENARDEFYKNMQFQIDTANTKWRQALTLQGNEMKFEAAATDVKNRLGIQTEMLNQLWDRSDAILDYAWKSSENQADRKNQIALMKLQGEMKLKDTEASGAGSLLGTLLGIGGDLLMGAFGF